MAKLKAEIKALDVLERMKHVLHIPNIAQLAKALNVSQQSLAQADKRQSVSLPILMKCMELAERDDVTLDYLVYGKVGDLAVESDYMNIQRIDIDEQSVKFYRQLLPQNITTTNLKCYIASDRLYLIDTFNSAIDADGVYALNSRKKPLFRECKILISGGYKIGDELIESADGLVILGRVIWSGGTI
jgi:transcriptional regulator with XRE-family HTH domain